MNYFYYISFTAHTAQPNTYFTYGEEDSFEKYCCVVFSPAIFCPFPTSMCNRFYAFVFGTKYRISTCIFLHTIQILLWLCRYFLQLMGENLPVCCNARAVTAKKNCKQFAAAGVMCFKKFANILRIGHCIRPTSMLKSKDRFYTLHQY